MRPDGGGHAPRGPAGEEGIGLAERLAQPRQLGDELGKDGVESILELLVRELDLGRLAPRAHDHVDRAVLEPHAFHGS